MRNRYRSIGAALLCATVFLAGCGSDDDNGSGSADTKATIAKADFIQAADEACEARSDEMEKKGQRVFAEASGKSRNDVAKELIENVVAPGFEGEVADIRALEPPPGEEQQLEEILTAIENMVDRMRKDLAVGRNIPYRKTENLAAAYGLPACGHP
jgi:hypothetical protein